MFCSLKSISFVVSLARASYVIVSVHYGEHGTGRIASSTQPLLPLLIAKKMNKIIQLHILESLKKIK